MASAAKERETVFEAKNQLNAAMNGIAAHHAAASKVLLSLPD